MDSIGALFDSKLIAEETLLKAMWGVVMYCWECLEHHIKIERDVRKTLDYMNNFENFYNKREGNVKEKGMRRVMLEETDEEVVWK